MKKDELYKEHLQEIFSIADIKTYSEEDIECVLDRLLKCLPNNGKLYKYRSIEGQGFDNAYDGLKNNYLWMAKANTLNDDFDCAINYNPDDCIEDALKVAFKSRKNLIAFLDIVSKKLTFKERLNIKSFSKELTEEEFDKLMLCADLQNMQFNYETAEGIMEDFGVPSKWAKITVKKIQNYVNELPKQKEKLIRKIGKTIISINKKIREKLFVFSMTENFDSDVMWGLYANSNNGFCIEYDFGKLKELSKNDKGKFLLLSKVKYLEKKAKFTFEDIYTYELHKKKDLELRKKINAKVLSQITTKDSQWERENEWRVLLWDLKSSKLFIDLVSGVIIDERVIKTNNAKKLIGLAKEKNWIVKIRKKNHTGTKHIYEELKEC